VLDPGEERAELHPLARAVGAARLKGMRAWAKACAERTSAHYAGFAEKNANQPLLVDAELENILAAAYLAFHHEQWEPLWAIGYALDAPLNYAGRWHAREQLLRLCSEGAKSSGSKRQHAAFSHNYAFALQQRGALDEAERLYRESLGIEREVGDKPGVAKSLHQLGMVAQLRGDPAEAERLYRESLMIEREVGDRPGEGESLHQLGMVAQDRGGLGEAERLDRESLAIAQEVGDRRGEATSLAQLGLLAEAQGDLSLAVERTQQAATIFDAMRLPEKEEAKAQLKRLRRRLGEERE
jgi:tetratricopeptide (TPR) repeat protein